MSKVNHLRLAPDPRFKGAYGTGSETDLDPLIEKYRQPKKQQSGPLQPSKKKASGEEICLTFNNCVVCGGKITDGPAGRWVLNDDVEVFTCSVNCDKVQELKPRNIVDPSIIKKVTHF